MTLEAKRFFLLCRIACMPNRPRCCQTSVKFMLFSCRRFGLHDALIRGFFVLSVSSTLACHQPKWRWVHMPPTNSNDQNK